MDAEANITGTRSKIFNEIVFKDNHLLTLHEKCIYITIIKFPFKRKACQVYEGGCCRQVSTGVSLVVW